MLPPPTSAFPPTPRSVSFTAPETATFPPTSTDSASSVSFTSTSPPTLTEPPQEIDLANILPPTSMSWALMVPLDLHGVGDVQALVHGEVPGDGQLAPLDREGVALEVAVYLGVALEVGAPG